MVLDEFSKLRHWQVCLMVNLRQNWHCYTHFPNFCHPFICLPSLKSRRFEKFHWFISSDNYLVLAGRDDVQNETLFKRYFRQHDIYVHADIHGASSVIVKARTLQPCEKSSEGKAKVVVKEKACFKMFITSLKGELWRDFIIKCLVVDAEDSGTAIPQPPMRTLFEAGHMAVALSNAWSSKVITNAWWVRYDQVSKTAPSGEYLPTGSFVIRGRKNVLPQCLLTYGIGILFKLGEDSVERHVGERCIDLESIAETRAILKRYDIVPQTDNIPEESEDEDADIARAFGNYVRLMCLSASRLLLTASLIKFHLVLNKSRSRLPTFRIKKPQIQAVQQPPKTNSPVKEKYPSRPQSKAKSMGPNPLKRGQKAKMKRIRQKYADQDDEERQMRQRILQGASGKLSAVHAIGKPPHPEEEDGEVEVEENNVEVEKVAEEHSLPRFDDNGQEEHSEMVDKKDKGKVNASSSRLEEDDGKVDFAGSLGDVSLLETLTGQPLAEDTLLFALPFCAPFSALQKFKYKAKLVPGVQKKGESKCCVKILLMFMFFFRVVTRVAIHHFTMDKEASDLEKQLIQAIREEDICRVLPGSAKIAFPEPILRPPSSRSTSAAQRQVIP
ncbi:unnamed protein product [Hydatigera taeniaeformis]|uniref:NFACT-R_1 domain-containing protein n=1 Tax=Hydatigena taeniaeformis TaxID=6205 RepID=A0A0R3X9M5_HYDTA|nr:unnamed protein product [Hydatigera taeniaeformis]